MDGLVVATAESPAGQAAPVAWFVEAGRTARAVAMAGGAAMAVTAVPVIPVIPALG